MIRFCVSPLSEATPAEIFLVSNLPLFSVGVMFVLCVASPRENLSRGPFLVAVALLMLCLGQNHAW